MKLSRLGVFVVPFLLSAVPSAFAAERTNPNLQVPGENADRAEPEVRTRDSETRSEKNWVMAFSGGLGHTNYSGPLKARIDGYRATANADDTATVNFDYYVAWALSNRKTVVGPSISVGMDMYNSDYLSDLSVTNIFLGATFVHYFEELKHGPFARLDVGFDAAQSSTDYTDNYEHSYEGAGFRVGIGYSIRAGERFGVPIMLQWQYASLDESASANTFLLSGGFTF